MLTKFSKDSSSLLHAASAEVVIQGPGESTFQVPPSPGWQAGDGVQPALWAKGLSSPPGLSVAAWPHSWHGG